MRRNILVFYFTLVSIVLFTCCSTKSNKNTSNRCKVTPFELKDVTLLDGPFKHATELNVKSLLNYEPDRLLAKFRSEAGLKPKASHYEGWESETIAGHSLGHYLTGCALMYQTTRDQRFLERVKYIVNELEECQMADADGYIGAFPKGKQILEEEVAKGDIRSQGFDLNGIWVPYYTEHKVMAGLRDAYHLCGIEKALQIEITFADWLYTIIKDLSDELIQKMLHCEHGGINEVLADLYNDTKDEKYLEMSGIFHHKAVLDSLAEGKDVLPDIHCNTQIPKLIGLARRYEITGDIKDRKAAEFFWQTVVHHHSYVTGGNGNHEYFGQPDQLRNRLSDETTETCNVYNMLKLSRHLFQWQPDGEIADYYERALFNHILSSQNPENGRVTYNLSLEMGGYKYFQEPEDFTCCIGTGMENHSKYGRNIFFKNDDELYVSQFIAAEANWQEKGFTIRQLTQFPEEQGTTIEFECAEPKEFILYIRYPYWAKKGIDIFINGNKQAFSQPAGSFVPLKRTWKSGDKVAIKMPFTLRVETTPDDENRLAIMYGPLVMAGDLGEIDDPKAAEPDFVPVIFSEDRNPAHWLEAVQNESNTFKLADKFARPHGFILRPFYKIYDHRYSVYWDLFNEARWQKHQEEYKAKLIRQKDLQARTIDFFQPGEMQQERNHKFTGEKIRVLDYLHKKARVADRGGWFSFEMKVNDEKPMALVVHYWGGFTGSKTFDILVDGTVIATENISGKRDGEFINISYEIPPELLPGKDKILVKFLPHEGHRGGPIFGVRTVKKL